MSLTKNAAKNIFDRLTWHTAKKDQAGIARELAEGEEVHEVYGLGEASLFDEFFNFLDELRFDEAFAKLKPMRKKRESPISFYKILLIYFMRIVAGLQFFNHIETVLLHSQPLMRLIGFNGRVINKGNNQRGVHRIKNRDKEQGSDTRRSPVYRYVPNRNCQWDQKARRLKKGFCSQTCCSNNLHVHDLHQFAGLHKTAAPKYH